MWEKKREEKKEIDKSGSTEQIQKLINIIRKIKELRNSITWSNKMINQITIKIMGLAGYI